MKILHIMDSAGLYGAEIMLLNLVAEQIELGLEPTIASIGEKEIDEKPLETAAIRRGFNVRNFRMKPGPNIGGALEVLRFAHAAGFEIMHSHGYKGNILFGFMPRRVRKLPLVSTLHGYTSTNGFTKMRVYEWLDTKSLKFIDRVVLVNKGMLNHPRLERLLGVNFQVVDNGIPLPTAAREDERIWADGKGGVDAEIADFCAKGFTVGTIGRLSTEKGYRYLIQALKLLQNEGLDARLVMIGEGYQRPELEKLVAAAGLSDRVFLPGYREGARRYLSLFNVFVMSSLTEGLPITLLEAMQAKVPIVATAVGGIPEVLDNGSAGLLVGPGKPGAISEAIHRVFAENQLGQKLGNAAYERVVTAYSSEAMAGHYLEIYQELLK
jgi:glycosyltransferase involved in cell wall biosynthesis